MCATHNMSKNMNTKKENIEKEETGRRQVLLLPLFFFFIFLDSISNPLQGNALPLDIKEIRLEFQKKKKEIDGRHFPITVKTIDVYCAFHRRPIADTTTNNHKMAELLRNSMAMLREIVDLKVVWPPLFH